MHEITPYRTTSHPLPPTDERGFSFQEEETTNLRDYWIVIRKYRWTITTFLLPIVLIVAIAVWRRPLVYTATATLYIENKTPNIMGAPEASALGERAFDQYYKTHLDLLKSRSLAARVIQDLGLEHDLRFETPVAGPPSGVQSHVLRSIGYVVRWLREMSLVKWIQERFSAVNVEEEKQIEMVEPGVPPTLIDRYLKKVEVSHVDESQLVRVRFSSLDPAFSTEVVNAHVTTFIRTSLLSRFELTAEARQFLEEKLADLRAKLERSEDDLNRFRKTHAIVAPEQGESLVLERLKALNVDLTQARSRRIELESLYRAVQQRDNRFLSQIIENPRVRQLKDQISAFEIEHSRQSTIFKPTHPTAIALQEQINHANGQLEQEIRRIVRSIASDYTAAKTKEEALSAEMEHQRRAALDLRAQALGVGILEREVQSNRTLYENVLKRSKETDLTGAASISNIRVVDQADIPSKPDDAHKKLTLLLSVFVGLLGGVGLAFLRHYLDNTLKTPEDIGRFLRLPTLGMVPDIRRLGRRVNRLRSTPKFASLQRLLKGQRAPEPGLQRVLRNVYKNRDCSWDSEVDIARKGETTGLVTSLHPLSLVSEAYQSLCTALLFSLPERPPRTLLITSAQPQEGKTVTAINIAVTLARNGAPVLLIDADLRHGHCHRLLDIQNGSGLTNVLTGNGRATEFIKKTAVNNLSLLSRGEPAPNPAALLGCEKMRQMLASLETAFPFIIIDSAPLLPITDTVLLSTMVDGVLLVAKAQEVSRYVVRQACERLTYVKAKVLGVVLNNIDIRSPEYKDYRSSYVGSYAADATDNNGTRAPRVLHGAALRYYAANATDNNGTRQRSTD